MAFIQVDYNNAVSQAKKLEQAASECHDAINAIKKELAELENGWQGNSGDAMKEKLLESLGELTQTEARLEQTASDIRSVAEELLERDREAAEKVKQVTAGFNALKNALDKFF